jgi:PAS domain S-box-containing protein
MAVPGVTLSQTVAGIGGNVDSALDEVRVATGVADRHGIIRWANASATELFGDCVGRPLTSLVSPESTHRQREQFAKKVLGTARTTDYRLTVLTPDGRRVPVEVSSVAIEGTDHRIVGVFGAVRPVAPPAVRPVRSSSLTPRQLEVLHALDHGLSTDQIAEHLGIQRDTVRNHIAGLMRTLGVHSRLEAVAEARRRGLLDN